MQDISEAIRHQQRAVQLTPDGHADLPSRLGNLGTSFSCRFERTGDMQDISEAIRHQQRAVQLTPDGHADLPTWLNNLGNSFSSLRTHWRHAGYFRGNPTSATCCPIDPRWTCLICHAGSIISETHFRRFERTGDMQDISEAIRHQQRAVQLTPDGHADLPSWLNNLGNSFLRRFERTGDMQDISEAIRHQQRAVQLTPDGHADLPSWLNNLGTSFSIRFERNGDMQDISEAIRHQQRAVQLTPDGHA
jgi:tetratricopeptide (TPR) repeat protein